MTVSHCTMSNSRGNPSDRDETEKENEDTIEPIQEKVLKMPSDHELRIEIEEKEGSSAAFTEMFQDIHEVLNVGVLIQLMNGAAECFGAEMVLKKLYPLFPGEKIAIFTFIGCDIKVMTTKCNFEMYMATETPMNFYFNLHVALQQEREACVTQQIELRQEILRKANIDDPNDDTAILARDVFKQPLSPIVSMNDDRPLLKGPRVLICGPSDAGKSSLSKILLNYAVRAGSAPLFVDLDVGQSEMTFPGCIGAAIVEKPTSVGQTDGFAHSDSIHFHYGHVNPETNPYAYDLLVMNLAEAVSNRLEALSRSYESGIIVNTNGFIHKEGYDSLISAIFALQITHIFVLSQERLFTKLSGEMDGNDDVKLVMVPQSGGCVRRTTDNRIQARTTRLHAYFNGRPLDLGSPLCSLVPKEFDVELSSIELYKIGTGDARLDEGLLPKDSEMSIGLTDRYTSPSPVKPSLSLQHRVMSISQATCKEDLVTSPIFGLVVCQSIDIENDTISLLAPHNECLPGRFVLVSDVVYMA